MARLVALGALFLTLLLQHEASAMVCPGLHEGNTVCSGAAGLVFPASTFNKTDGWYTGDKVWTCYNGAQRCIDWMCSDYPGVYGLSTNFQQCTYGCDLSVGCKSCSPNCSGKQCGSNGCGGTCGTCPGGYSCNGSQCILVCTPNCSGKQCGPNGCGGSCGSCGGGQTCQSGLCVGTGPQCADCSSNSDCMAGYQCGSWTANTAINFCQKPCASTANCPSGSTCANSYCVPDWHYQCVGNALYNYDSCGNQVSKSKDCASSCYNGSCVGTGDQCASCTSSESCLAGYRCGSWADNPAVTFCKKPCSSTADCPANNSCVNSFCVPYWQYKCVGNALYDYDTCGNQIAKEKDCANGCETNHCAGTGGQCSTCNVSFTTDSDCKAGFACTSWQDAPSVTFCMGPCSSDGDCPSNAACRDSFCVPYWKYQCVSNSLYLYDECGNAIKKDHDCSGTCDRDHCAGSVDQCGACPGTSNTDSPCQPGFMCVHWSDNQDVTFCVKPCSEDAECPSEMACLPLSSGEQKYCLPYWQRKCEGSSLFNFDTCGNQVTKEKDCEHGCDGSFCAGLGEQCDACNVSITTDSDCKQGFVCSNWAEAPEVTFCRAPCTVDGDCPTGDSCADSYCVPSWTSQCLENSVFAFDSCGNQLMKQEDCAGEAICMDGKCTVPCKPDCALKECGDDGCGGICGSCGAGEECDPLLQVCVEFPADTGSTDAATTDDLGGSDAQGNDLQGTDTVPTEDPGTNRDTFEADSSQDTAIDIDAVAPQEDTAVERDSLVSDSLGTDASRDVTIILDTATSPDAGDTPKNKSGGGCSTSKSTNGATALWLLGLVCVLLGIRRRRLIE